MEDLGQEAMDSMEDPALMRLLVVLMVLGQTILPTGLLDPNIPLATGHMVDHKGDLTEDPWVPALCHLMGHHFRPVGPPLMEHQVLKQALALDPFHQQVPGPQAVAEPRVPALMPLRAPRRQQRLPCWRQPNREHQAHHRLPELEGTALPQILAVVSLDL